MQILLALDDSRHSAAALQAVMGQNIPQNTSVRVVYVIEPIPFALPPAVVAEYVETRPPASLHKVQMEKAQELVANALGKLRAAGFEGEAAILEGDPRAEIIDFASAWPADLIVVGSHGKKALERFLLGSVSDFVARHAHCSVEIVRIPPETEFGG